MINLDIEAIIELYGGTDPGWDGNELARFFNCGYQTIYNRMEKYGVLRRNPLETQIRLFVGLGIERQTIFKCAKCKAVMIFSKRTNPYKYLFRCPDCNNLFYPDIRYRVTKPEDIERVNKYKEIANELDSLYAEGEGINR